MQARYSQRIGVECPVMFAGDNSIGEGRILDLSLPGCLLESSEKIIEGEYVQLRLFLPDAQTPLQVSLAAVRWVDGIRVGLEFICTSHDQQRRLEHFVRRRLVPNGASVRNEGIEVMRAMGS
ncbi:MAG: PilZ domain-containing protein [Nitrospira sp.]